MIRNLSALAVLHTVAFLIAGNPPPVCGDLIKLNNNGELRGRIDRHAKHTDETVTIETITGAVVVVQRKDVQFVTRRRYEVEEYETRAKLVADTVEAHWELAEWCRQNLLKPQRHEQLEHVVRLSPDHERAHYGLGHTKHDGEWMTRDEYKRSQGFVPYKGGYILPQELELREKTEAELAEEREWHRKILLWYGWVTGSNEDRFHAGLAELQQINDENAVAGLLRHLAGDEDKRIRLLCVKILAGMTGAKSAEALVRAALLDADHEVRAAAVKGISEEQRKTAIASFIRELDSDQNTTVCRAAVALGKLGDDETVPHLIGALVTTHRYKVTVPGSNSPTIRFGTNGSFGSGATSSVLPPEIEGMLRTGQLPNGVVVRRSPTGGENLMRKTITIKHTHRNTEVLDALVKLTDKNLGYNERDWRIWWLSQKNQTG